MLVSKLFLVFFYHVSFVFYGGGAHLGGWNDALITATGLDLPVQLRLLYCGATLCVG